MSDCQLGKRDEAQRALAQALAIQQSHEPKPESSDDLGPRWNDWLIVHALVREAQTLIEGPQSNSSSDSKAAPPTVLMREAKGLIPHNNTDGADDSKARQP